MLTSMYGNKVAPLKCPRRESAKRAAAQESRVAVTRTGGERKVNGKNLMHVHFDARALSRVVGILCARALFSSLWQPVALHVQLSSTATARSNMSLNSNWSMLVCSALASRSYWIFAVQPSANTANKQSQQPDGWRESERVRAHMCTAGLLLRRRALAAAATAAASPQRQTDQFACNDRP